METPEIIQTPNLEALKEICEDYIKFLGSDEYHEDNDFMHYIFEAAMEAMYGPDVWKYVNDKEP